MTLHQPLTEHLQELHLLDSLILDQIAGSSILSLPNVSHHTETTLLKDTKDLLFKAGMLCDECSRLQTQFDQSNSQFTQLHSTKSIVETNLSSVNSIIAQLDNLSDLDPQHPSVAIFSAVLHLQSHLSQPSISSALASDTLSEILSFIDDYISSTGSFVCSSLVFEWDFDRLSFTVTSSSALDLIQALQDTHPIYFDTFASSIAQFVRFLLQNPFSISESDFPCRIYTNPALNFSECISTHAHSQIIQFFTRIFGDKLVSSAIKPVLTRFPTNCFPFHTTRFFFTNLCSSKTFKDSLVHTSLSSSSLPPQMIFGQLNELNTILLSLRSFDHLNSALTLLSPHNSPFYQDDLSKSIGPFILWSLLFFYYRSFLLDNINQKSPVFNDCFQTGTRIQSLYITDNQYHNTYYTVKKS
ncbi:hypothetical protein GEMRC1_010895 [Eukaryota sp. GEM-RC1]